MLIKSDKPIVDVIKAYAHHGVEAAYLVPTPTGIKKGILDAHVSLREFLKSKKIHDYNTQGQGEDDKKIIGCWLIEEKIKTRTKISLYRPAAKKGDPRIWIYGLGNYAKSYNLLSFIEFSGEIYIVNVSRKEIFEKLDDVSTPLGSLMNMMSCANDCVADELLSKIKTISKQGFVKSLRKGSTGIGMTLETLLGISANSKKAPDYKGIEIKASRTSPKSKRANCRVSLFSKVPDWKNSKVKSASEILKKFGYVDCETNRLQLYCTLDIKPNSLGLFLKIDDEERHLESMCKRADVIENVVQWQLDELRSALKEKHRQTFWVKARAKVVGDGEEFHYYEIVETRNPLIENFSTLVEIGAITMDFTLSFVPKPSGKGLRPRDHGYLFKIHPDHFDLLFPPSKTHYLD